jgi:hypothetical protein
MTTSEVPVRSVEDLGEHNKNQSPTVSAIKLGRRAKFQHWNQETFGETFPVG